MKSNSLLVLSAFGAVVWGASPALAGSGACCFNLSGGPANSCALLPSSDCLALAGSTYEGDGTSCRTAACLGSPRGACCRSDPDSCRLSVGGQAGCSAVLLNGSYRGDGTSCNETASGPDLCPTCGDNQVNGPGEQCDGTSSSACPGQCQADCRCPGGATVPTLSAWGLGGLALLLMSGVALKFGRRRTA